MEELRDFRPATVEEAENVLAARLSEHGVALSPAVCIHEGRMVTVSSSIVVLGPGVARYRHSEGRPCEHPAQGLSHLLGDPAGIGTPSPVA
jgi:hypothetical protein